MTTPPFTTVCNHNERAVFDTVLAAAPRYIRHEVDFAFYLSERERGDSERHLAEAVDYAFGFVQARTAMRARA